MVQLLKTCKQARILWVVFICLWMAGGRMAWGDAIPIPLIGFNEDVVSENSPTPFARGFDVSSGVAAWFEAGLGGHMDGLPPSRSFVSDRIRGPV